MDSRRHTPELKDMTVRQRANVVDKSSALEPFPEGLQSAALDLTTYPLAKTT